MKGCPGNSGYRDRTRWCTNPVKPVYQRYQIGTVLIGDRCEFQAEAAVGNGVADYRFGADLPFRNEKLELHFLPLGARDRGREEHSTHAEVADTRNIFDSSASPADPDIPKRVNSGNDSSRVQRSHQPCGCHSRPPGPGELRAWLKEGTTRPQGSGER